MSSYTIDALALLGASTVRNVRSYQEKGLLPAPTRRGRSAIYDDRHLARLRTIGALLGRGYSLASISELINFWQTGRDFDDLLGLEEALALPFSEEEPAVMTAEAVAEIWGNAPFSRMRSPSASSRSRRTGRSAFQACVSSTRASRFGKPAWTDGPCCRSSYFYETILKD